MADSTLSTRGGRITETGAHTVTSTDPGIWQLDNSAGATISSVTEKYADDDNATASTEFTGATGRETFPVLGGKTIVITVGTMPSGKSIKFERVAAFDDRHLNSTDLPA